MINRLKYFSLYLGFAPFYPSIWRRSKLDGLMLKHYKQAMALFSLHLIILLSIILLWVVLKQIIAHYSPGAIEKYMFYGIFITDFIIVFLILITIFLFVVSIFNVLTGKNKKIPIITKISEKDCIISISFYWNIFILLLPFIITLITIHSLSLAYNSNDEAEIYMLYDDMGIFPRWVFTLGFYRISSIVNDKWGSEKVKIEPITHSSLKNALSKGKVVFLSVHGPLSNHGYAGSFFYFSDKRDECYFVGPEQIEKIGYGSNLQYVYLAACNSGKLKKEWDEAFSPARIRTFNRISTYPDHLYWLFIKGPNIVKSL